MPKGGSIKTVDKRSKADQMLAAMGAVAESYVTIGVNEREGTKVHPGNIELKGAAGRRRATVAEVAFWAEFGTRTAPERSWLRSTVDENMNLFEAVRDKALNDIAAGKTTPKQGLSQLGFVIRESCKNKIKMGPFAPNAPSTAARKGGNKPLIDSTLFLRSITYVTKIVGGRD